MNSNIIKIINQLGYTIDYNSFGLKLYDKNHQELKKINITEDNYDGVNYISDNGQEICFMSNGFVTVKFNDNVTIIAHNLYNEENMDYIRIFFDSPTLDFDYMIDIIVSKSNQDNINGSIVISFNGSSLFQNEKDNIMLSIEDRMDGAIIALTGKDDEYISVNECTVHNYCKIINSFAKMISDKYNLQVKDSFDIVTPSVITLVDNLVERRNKKINNNITKKRL